MNVPSKKLGKKDVVKIEGRELSIAEVDEIALVAPQTTINIIRNFKLVKKNKVKIPTFIKEIFKCVNPSCISNTQEPIRSAFHIEEKEPILLKCYYCGVHLEKNDIIKQF